MNSLISIIVPVYNIESYIHKCVDSLIAQTYHNIEIILVDDGSSDKCHEICDEYKDKDLRIKVIHKENGGLSDARNAGIEASNGEYLTFIDGDDWIEPETVEKLMCAIEENNADIVAYGANIVTENYCTAYSEKPQYEKTSFNDYMKMVFWGQRTPSVCTKLFSREIIGNMRFLKGRLNEDFYFSSQMFLNNGVIVTIPFAGYNYYQRSGSITHSGINNKSVADAVTNCIEIYNDVLSYDNTLVPSLSTMALHQASVLIRNINKRHLTKDNENLQLVIKCIEIYIPYIKDTKLRFHEKMIVKMAYRMPVLTCKTLCIVRKLRK